MGGVDDFKVRLRRVFALLRFTVFSVIDIAVPARHLESVRHQAFKTDQWDLGIAILVGRLVFGVRGGDDDEILTVSHGLWLGLVRLGDDKAEVFEVFDDMVV